MMPINSQKHYNKGTHVKDGKEGMGEYKICFTFWQENLTKDDIHQ